MASVKVKFKSNEAASEFAATLSTMGNKADVSIDESTAVISSEDPAAVRFVKSMAEEMFQEKMWSAYANRMLSTIMKCVAEDKSESVVLMDNTKQIVTKRQAEALVSMHDRLSEENQISFLLLASESQDSYMHALNFAKTNEEID